MVNASEPAINLVTYNMPKTLIGMNQNGEWTGPWILFFQGKDISSTGEKLVPNLPTSLMRNTVSPYFRPQGQD